MGTKKEKVEAQGIFGALGLFDQETVDKIKAILQAVDPEKLKQIIDLLEVDEEGWLKIKMVLDMGLRK